MRCETERVVYGLHLHVARCFGFCPSGSTRRPDRLYVLQSSKTFLYSILLLPLWRFLAYACSNSSRILRAGSEFGRPDRPFGEGEASGLSSRRSRGWWWLPREASEAWAVVGLARMPGRLACLSDGMLAELLSFHARGTIGTASSSKESGSIRFRW